MVEEGKDGANIRWGLDKTIIVVIVSHPGDGDGDGDVDGEGESEGEWMDGQ